MGTDSIAVEIMNAIDDWRAGDLGDFEVLSVIDYWRARDSFST